MAKLYRAWRQNHGESEGHPGRRRSDIWFPLEGENAPRYAARADAMAAVETTFRDYPVTPTHEAVARARLLAGMTVEWRHLTIQIREES